jgi:hypothetical protein
LTQAATKVERCPTIASLLATDSRKSDTLGKEITLKEDVAEVCAGASSLPIDPQP